MKILEANAGPLTNFEVLEFLRSKDPEKDPTPTMFPNFSSEHKVFEYLDKSSCKYLTREVIDEFLEECKRFKISKAEKLNLINIMPKSVPELYPILESCDDRVKSEEDEFLLEIVATVKRVLLAPPPPPPPKEEGIEEVHEENVVEDAE